MQAPAPGARCRMRMPSHQSSKPKSTTSSARNQSCPSSLFGRIGRDRRCAHDRAKRQPAAGGRNYISTLSVWRLQPNCACSSKMLASRGSRWCKLDQRAYLGVRVGRPLHRNTHYRRGVLLLSTERGLNSRNSILRKSPADVLRRQRVTTAFAADYPPAGVSRSSPFLLRMAGYLVRTAFASCPSCSPDPSAKRRLRIYVGP